MEQKQIPYFAHEGITARMERINRRLFTVSVIEGVAVIIAIIATFKKDKDKE